MKKRRKWIIITIVAVLVLLVIGWLVSKSQKSKAKEEVVRIEEIGRSDLTELVSAPGEIEPNETVQISAKVSAQILEMPYDEGDVVTCGDQNANPPIPPSMLLKLDAKDLESQLKSAEAGRAAQEMGIEVEKSRIEGTKATMVGLAATLEQAQKDLERKKGLYESRDISKSDFDLIKYKVDELAAQYESAKYNLTASEQNLKVMKHNLDAADARIEEVRQYYSYTTINSPINGVVTRVNAKVGEMVMTGTMNNPGTVIMEVSDLSRMLLVAQVDEADIGGLKLGQTASVGVNAFPDIEFKGVVSEIALKHRWSDTRTRYYRTEILLDNDPNVAKLYTGLAAHVDIKTQKHEGVVKVPSQAVLAREVEELPLDVREKNTDVDKSKTFATVVYKYMDGKAMATPVRIGASDLTHTIILSGLKEGDKVIVGPYKVLEKIKHDQKVRDERDVEKEKNKKEESKKAKVKSKKDSNNPDEPADK